MLFKVCTIVTILMCVVIQELYYPSAEGLVMIGELLSSARFLYNIMHIVVLAYSLIWLAFSALMMIG